MSVEELLRRLRERIEQLVEKGYIRPSANPYMCTLGIVSR
eukprot:gene22681-27379_t